MAAITRFLGHLRRNIFLSEPNRGIALSATNRLKEFVEKKEGNTLVVEAVLKPDENEARLLKTKNGACPVCSSGLDIKHTDVLILSQFLRSDGCMLPRRITGLCKIQQKRMGSLITMAQKAGLMPNIAPSFSNKDPKKRYQWKKYNKYYDEDTIKFKYYE